jgi:hypothetical protein
LLRWSSCANHESIYCFCPVVTTDVQDVRMRLSDLFRIRISLKKWFLNPPLWGGHLLRPSWRAEGGIKLQTGYLSEIRPPPLRVRSRRVVLVGGLTHWGHLIKSFLIQSHTSPSIDLVDQREAPWPPRQSGSHRRI